MTSTPLALIAEVTHRCPLRCVYCSNPVEMISSKEELCTGEWTRVFEEAGSLGVLHLHLSGGEPVARADLKQLVEVAHWNGLYTNLITSGIGLSESRFAELVEAGLDHIQLSFQDSHERPAKWLAGANVHNCKVQVARYVRRFSVAFTVNLVVHRQNLDHIEEMVAFIEDLAPDRVEIAHAQYYGWALVNRTMLLPTREQMDKCRQVVEAAQQRLAGRTRFDCVVPDYFARFPKPCMGGWGRQLMVIDPNGRVLPCHAAGVIPGMTFNNVREHSLAWIWRESPAFQRFRGNNWMLEPCRSCERRDVDFGGCRCQAFLIAGNPNATDPVCCLSPDHGMVEEILAESVVANQVPWCYRKNP